MEAAVLRRVAFILVLLLLTVAAVNPVFADGDGPREHPVHPTRKPRDDDEREKSKNLPEVPLVVIYPAAGVVTYLGYRMIAARRERPSTAA